MGTFCRWSGWMVSKRRKSMSDRKPDPSSDAARTGEDADKDREELKKKAEKGIEDATGKKPKGEI